MTKKQEIVKVKALRYHTFAGIERQEGDTYEVEGDSTQTAEQYATTLGALSFAAVHVGSDDQDDEPAAGKKSKGDYQTREMKVQRR